MKVKNFFVALKCETGTCTGRINEHQNKKKYPVLLPQAIFELR